MNVNRNKIKEYVGDKGGKVGNEPFKSKLNFLGYSGNDDSDFRKD